MRSDDIRRLNLLAYVHMRNIHNSTGAGRTARQLVEHLSCRPDINLEVLADASDMARVLPLVKEPWTNYRFHPFQADTSRQQARWFFLDDPPAERFWPDADVVFCTAESYVPVRTARLVMTAHDAGYFESGAHTRDTTYWKARFKWTLLFQKLARKVDLFHTVSQFSADRLAHFFPAIRSRVRCVHNGVTPHLFGPVPDAGLEYLDVAGLASRPFVLIPGGLHYRKNAELILQAAPLLLRQFPDLILAVVNHCNPTYAESAQKLGPRFKLQGFVSDEALHALYTAATVVWFPSRYEGFGLPVIEAMACGTPVVASNASSIPEIAGQAAILVDPGDAQGHVAAIASLLTDPLARQQFASAGRERSAGFTWQRSAAQLKQHFDTLV